MKSALLFVLDVPVVPRAIVTCVPGVAVTLLALCTKTRLTVELPVTVKAPVTARLVLEIKNESVFTEVPVRVMLAKVFVPVPLLPPIAAWPDPENTKLSPLKFPKVVELIPNVTPAPVKVIIAVLVVMVRAENLKFEVVGNVIVIEEVPMDIVRVVVLLELNIPHVIETLFVE